MDARVALTIITAIYCNAHIGIKYLLSTTPLLQRRVLILRVRKA